MMRFIENGVECEYEDSVVSEILTRDYSVIINKISPHFRKSKIPELFASAFMSAAMTGFYITGYSLEEALMLVRKRFSMLESDADYTKHREAFLKGSRR